MKKEYEKQKKILLNLSKQQQRDLPAIYGVLLAMKYHNLRGDELDQINPEWLKQEIKWHKEFDITHWNLKQGENQEYGLFNIKKTKKGFVLQINITWRIKGTKIDYWACSVCGKKVPLNTKFRCKNCRGKKMPIFKELFE